jgi:flavin-dependent dehydrogenase
MSGADADVAVIGAGPAGSSIAIRLARLGYDVRIFEAARFPRPHIGESLHANIVSLFEELGVSEEIQDAGFLRPRGAVVRWAGETRLRSEAAEGFQVDRGRFDAILLHAAARAGARVSQPARVTQFEKIHQGAWRLIVMESGVSWQCSCRFVVDATGRTGCLTGRRRLNLQPQTMAIYAYWRCPNWAGDETLIEAGADRWYWAAPLPDGSVNATVFVDATLIDGRGRAGLTELYLRLLRDFTLTTGHLRGSLSTSVRACSAAASCTADPIGEGWIKIGEAAIALDPLSSQGVQHAISSGLQGAAVVNSMLAYPESRAAAIAFCREHLVETARQHTATAAIFYREQDDATPSSFWNSRAKGSVPDSTRAARRPHVLAMDAPLRLNPLATWQQSPALWDDRISWRSALHLPGRRPIIWLEGEAVADLIQPPFVWLSAHELLASWSAVMGSHLAIRILEFLCAEGFMIQSEGDAIRSIKKYI